MKPFFGAIILTLILFFNKIEAADNRRKITTTNTATAPESDDKAREEDHRRTMVLGTPARSKIPHAPGRPLHSNVLAKPDLPDKTGEKAFNLFLEHYRERGLPDASNESLNLYNERHAGGSYHLPEEQSGSITHRVDEARRKAKKPLVQQHRQQHRHFQDHCGDSGSSSKGKFTGESAKNMFVDHYREPRASGGPSSTEFVPKPQVDTTAENVYNLFLDHYREKGLPNAPDVTLKLYEERHSGGSYKLPEEFTSGESTRKIKEVRNRILRQPFVKQEHQQMYQQHQGFQDHSERSGSSSRGTDKRNQKQYNVRDQSGGSGLRSVSNNPYTAPPLTPSEDVYAHFDIQPPKHLDFEKSSSQNNSSATALIDNYNIHLRRKHGDHSKGSGSNKER